MVEISRDGRRAYFTNSLYGAIDPQFYHQGLDGWMVKVDLDPNGGMKLDESYGSETSYWMKSPVPQQEA